MRKKINGTKTTIAKNFTPAAPTRRAIPAPISNGIIKIANIIMKVNNVVIKSILFTL